MATPQHLKRPRIPRKREKDGYILFLRAHPNGQRFKAVPHKDEQGNEINNQHFFKLRFDNGGMDGGIVTKYARKGYAVIDVYLSEDFIRKYARGSASMTEFDKLAPMEIKQAIQTAETFKQMHLPQYQQDLQNYKPGDENFDMGVDDEHDESVLAEVEALSTAARAQKKKQETKRKEEAATQTA